MARTIQRFDGGIGEAAWLSGLVGTFETITRSNAPCAPLKTHEIDRSEMAALMNQLGRAADSQAARYAMAG